MKLPIALPPVVDREFRVRARRPGTHWMRAGLIAVGAVICLGVFTSPVGAAAPQQLGLVLFTILRWMMFILAAGACVLTADSLSMERREGTLGLLFLARLSGRDVVLGKLLAAGLQMFYVMLGFVPLLMVPLAVGGVSMSAVAQTALALVHLLFCALAAGLWASSRRRERGQAVRHAFGGFFLWLVLPFAVELGLNRFVAGLPWGAIPHTVSLLSPLSPFVLSKAAEYWPALVLGQGVAWVLLHRAGRAAQGEWHDTRTVSPTKALAEDSLAAAAQAAITNVASKDDDPVGWLVERQHGEHWFFSGAFWLVVIPWGISAVAWSTTISFAETGLLLVLRIGFGLGACGLMAFAASRFFLENRRDGVVELLLSSPVGEDIVRGQWRATRRTLDPAVGILGMVCLGFFLLLAFRSSFSVARGMSLMGLGLAMANDVVRLVAACWVGMWFGLRTRDNSSAVAWTILLVCGLPWLALVVFNVVVALGGAGSAGPAAGVTHQVWGAASGILLLAMSLRWIIWVRRELNRDLREAFAEPTRPGATLAVAALSGFFGGAAALGSVPARIEK